MTRPASRNYIKNEAHGFDLSQISVREVNQALHNLSSGTSEMRVSLQNPAGLHALAAGVDAADTDLEQVISLGRRLLQAKSVTDYDARGSDVPIDADDPMHLVLRLQT